MSEPTIRELLEDSSPEDTVAHCLLAERVEAVLKLHVESKEHPGECAGCIVHDWPCPTYRALDGSWPCGHARVHPEDELCRECAP